MYYTSMKHFVFNGTPCDERFSCKLTYLSI